MDVYSVMGTCCLPPTCYKLCDITNEKENNKGKEKDMNGHRCEAWINITHTIMTRKKVSD